MDPHPPSTFLDGSTANSDQPLPDKRLAARECVDILEEIAVLLNVHLDRKSLSMCISLIENGVDPEALATVIRELRKER